MAQDWQEWQFKPGDEFNIGDDIRIVVKIRSHLDWIDTGYTPDAGVFGQTPDWYREHGSNFRRADEAILNAKLKSIVDPVLVEAVDEIDDAVDLNFETRIRYSPDGWTEWEYEVHDDELSEAVRGVFELASGGNKIAKVTVHWDSGVKYQFKPAKS